MKKWIFYFFYTLILSTKIYAWWDVPHMLIAQIAYDQLQPSTREQAENLLTYFKDDFPQSSTFITSSCFADDMTTLGLSGFKVWHGMLTPYSPDNTLSENSKRCIETL